MYVLETVYAELIVFSSDYQGLCAQSFFGHQHSVNHASFNLKVSE